MDEQLKPNQIEADIRHKEAWGGVTDPKEHQDNHFRYLVYAFKPYAAIGQRIVSVNVAKADLETRQTGSVVDLLNNPDKISKREFISLSLIDEKHRATWGNYGLVVEVPKVNVILVSTSDAGSVHASTDVLKQQAQEHPPISWDQLLANSSPNTYNEVVALGSSGQGEAKVVGFFAKIDEGGYLDRSQVYKLKQHAERLNLPFIEIKAENPYEQDSFEFTSNGDGVYVTHAGKRYILRSGGKPEFDILNSRRKNHFMSPTEADEFFKFFEAAINNGQTSIGKAILDNLRKEYELLNKTRRSPSFKVDKDGNVESFSFFTGYDTQEFEYAINQHGAHKINTTGLKAEMEKSLVEGDSYIHPNDISHYQVRVSPEEIKKLLKDISGFADPEIVKKANEFIDAHREQMRDTYNQEVRMRNKASKITTSFYAVDYGKFLSDIKPFSSDIEFKPKDKPTDGD